MKDPKKSDIESIIIFVILGFMTVAVFYLFQVLLTPPQDILRNRQPAANSSINIPLLPDKGQ